MEYDPYEAHNKKKEVFCYPRPGRESRVTHFRILVIGNANAGKTTIIEKVCHATGHTPIISESQTLSDLKPSTERGVHDIETEFTYPTALGFVFHDSCGFEAGTSDELERVKKFINARAKKTQMDKQLHAIWYCLSTSSDRPLTEAEMSLFEIGTGDVPVIAIFTKMDALEKKAFNELLCNQGKSIGDAKVGKTALAQANFQQHYLNRLEGVSHRPAHIIQLYDMNKPDTRCDELIEKTSEALNVEALKLLKTSVLRNNLDRSIENALNVLTMRQHGLLMGNFSASENPQKELVRNVMQCFPHVSSKLFNKETNNLVGNAVQAANLVMTKQISAMQQEMSVDFKPALVAVQTRAFVFMKQLESEDLIEDFEDTVSECFDILLELLPSLEVTGPNMPTHYQTLLLGSTMITVLADTCFLPLELPFKDNFRMALEAYKYAFQLWELNTQVTKLYKNIREITKETLLKSALAKLPH